MRRLNLTPAILAVFAACFTPASARWAHAQDWRGAGRIQGSVVDESGQPIQGATLKANCAERGGGTTIQSNKKGEWVLGGVVGCRWAFDVSAEGYETLQISINLPGESARLAPVKVPLKKTKTAGGPSPTHRPPGLSRLAGPRGCISHFERRRVNDASSEGGNGAILRFCFPLTVLPLLAAASVLHEVEQGGRCPDVLRTSCERRSHRRSACGPEAGVRTTISSSCSIRYAPR